MTSKPADCKMCTRFGLKPLTRENVLFFYIPAHSIASYAALSINVMNPSLAARIVPNKDVTNILLLQTLFGVTLYIYNRPHLKAVTSGKKAAYSLLGGSLFSLGSVLFWAIVRSAMPKTSSAGTLVGLVSGAAILKLSYDYLEDSDKNVIKAN